MDFQKYKPNFDRDGFVVIPRFLIGADFVNLANNLDRYIREVVPSLSDSQAFYHDKSQPATLKQLQHMGHDNFFATYEKHPRWSALAETFLGEPVDVRQQPEWFNKPPATDHPTPPHQDNHYFSTKPPNALTAWLALDPVDLENGCLRYIAGSHRTGRRPHSATRVLGFSQGIANYGPDDEERETAVKLQRGDLVVHHCETIHRADPNRSTTRHRRAFAMVFFGRSCCRDEESRQTYAAKLQQQHESLGLDTD